MKFTEEQRYAIIEAVYNHVGDEYDKDEHGNAALKLDSQDIKFLNRLESILSPLPHQDGASAEDVLMQYAIHGYKAIYDTVFTFSKIDALKAMHQFAQSEVEKAVAEKDREIAELKGDVEIIEKYPEHWHYQYNISSEKLRAAKSRISELIKESNYLRLSEASYIALVNDMESRIAHLEQGMSNWVRVANERQDELNEAERRVKELEEEKKRLHFIIENGLGEKDLENDI